MKRAAGSEFDDSGAKWFQSPYYKEVKGDVNSEESLKLKEQSKRFNSEYDKESRLKKERFYDLYARVNKEGEFRLDIDELTKTLNVRSEDIPDAYKISNVFEDLNSKSAVISRGKKNWSEQETLLLIWIVVAYGTLNNCDYNDLGDKDWDAIGRIYPSKSLDQCKTRWQGLLKMNLTKAPWNQEEDKMLMSIIQEKGPKKWKEIAFELNKRMDSSKVFRQGKQCRERWINHLDPTINRGSWTNEEDLKLLETHLSIGKKWAEIAKVLKSRTENAVKNRWNSLIKKYRAEYGIDFDTLSTSSAYSNKSMEDLEKKIAEMLITNKRKGNIDSSPDRNSLVHDQILEVPEEESPGYYSDFSHDTNLVKNESGKSYVKKEDESDRIDGKSRDSKRKKKPVTSVSLAKNNLRDMVHEEIINHPNPSFQQQKSNSNDSTPLTPSDNLLDDPNSAQQIFMFGSNPEQIGTLEFRQDPNMPQPEPMNQSPMPLMNQFPKESRSNLYNMTNDVLNFNIWRNNLSNMNVFPQSPQQNNMHPNLFNIYNQGNIFQQSTYNLAPAGLPTADTFAQKSIPAQPNPTPAEQVIKMGEHKPLVEEIPERSFTLKEKPIGQFVPPEAPQNNLYYAVVDLSGGQMYLLDAISKDNYPPAFSQSKLKNTNMGNTSMNSNMDIIANSPHMNHTAWASPGLTAANLINYPLFNNNFPSLGFPNPQFSPNINNLFHESPKFDHNIFNTTPLMEGRGTNDWTPDGLGRSFFGGLSMKQRIGLANSRGETPPNEIGSNNGPFVRRMNDRSKNGSGISTDGMKYNNSPSSFLTVSQANQTRNKIAALEGKIKN